MKTEALTPGGLEELRRLSTCVVASAIETFSLRLPNTGFANAGVRCIFPDLPPVVGYAATARIRSAAPPMAGHSYYARTDWWDHLVTTPEPRVVVIQDLDHPPGLGAFIGEVHAHILMALGCVGLVTNGAVRDLLEVRRTGFQMFAGNVSVSHAYAHVFDFGGPVEVGGLEVRPGDLIHGDLHGIQTVPREIAGRVAGAAQKIIDKRHQVIGLCRSSDFSLEKLREAVEVSR